MLSFRSACLNDAALLLRWHNDLITRAMSEHAEKVSLEDYRAWLFGRLSDPDTKFRIAELDKIPVGSFRVSGDSVCYQVAPEFRRNGVATAMLQEIKRTYGPVRAEIFADNVASIKVATRAGLDVLVILRELDDLAPTIS